MDHFKNFTIIFAGIVAGMALLVVSLSAADNVVTGPDDCQRYLARNGVDPQVIRSLDTYRHGPLSGIVRAESVESTNWTLDQRLELGRYLQRNGLANPEGGGSGSRACRQIARFPG